MNAPSIVRRLALFAVLAVATGCGAAATSAPAGSAAPSQALVAPPAGFPTGTFTKDISADDYAAAAVSDPAVGNNVGRFTLVLGPDGRWTNVLDSGGATQVNPVSDQFHGDRAGSVRDPFGHRWSISTHIEDVSAEEMERRMAEFA